MLRATVTTTARAAPTRRSAPAWPAWSAAWPRFDGILAVSSPAGGPTILVIEVPCALSGHAPARPARSA